MGILGLFLMVLFAAARRRTLVFVAAVGCLLIPGVALGATVENISLAELVAESDVVVHARVLEKRSFVEGPRDWVYTETTIEVLEVWRGKVGKGASLTVRQLGGVVGDREMAVNGNAALTAGEEVILFLDSDEKKDRHYIVGMAFGKFTVTATGPKPTVTRSVGPVGSVLKPRAAAAALTLETLKTRVQALCQ
jgi:hypothetical protein